MPSSHLILCHPLLLRPSVFPSIRVFSTKSVLCIRWPKYSSFSFSISPSNEYSGLISFRRDWLDLLAIQGTLKSLLQHQSSKASILRHSAFFIVQLSCSSCLLPTHHCSLHLVWGRGTILFCFIWICEKAPAPFIAKDHCYSLKHCLWYKSSAEYAWIFFWSFSAVLGTYLLCYSVTLFLIPKASSNLEMQIVSSWSSSECLGSSHPFPFPYTFSSPIYVLRISGSGSTKRAKYLLRFWLWFNWINL